MEFWGIEVKAGEPFKVTPGEDKIIHLSQASLGESKKDKGNDSVPLFLKFDDQKIVLGTLSTEKYPQISFDLLFEKEFELSHNWKNGSVYFCGYKTDIPEHLLLATEGYSDFDSSEEEEFDIPLTNALSGKPVPKVEQVKPANAKVELKVVEPTDEDEDDSTDDDDSSDDEDMLLAGDESEDGDEDTEDDEETPKKAESGKKRPSESASKTPVPAKKGKLATPQKTDGKKGGHTATPHPSKQTGKTPANGEKSKAQTPKSGGQVSCKSCSKTFNSDGALQSHTKAKHSGGN